MVESLIHGGIANEAEVTIKWFDSEEFTDEATTVAALSQADGIIVPGGFGDRGIEGMILAAQYARTHNVPYFGICLGMQIQVIEHARHVLHMEDANSTEMNPNTTHPVIDLMPDQNGVVLGGTLRLGKFRCALTEGSIAQKAYKSQEIWERHRHRYEFNNKYRKEFENSTLLLAGVNPERNLVEIVEQKNHPWMVGVQFHPEFKSRPNRAHPFFREFIAASVANKEKEGTK